MVWFKPEGYEAVEQQLFRGAFKNGLFHGPGQLFHPGTQQLAYLGRFKAGKKHGRGIEFDEHEVKVYQGTFREGVREGRGELFENKVRVYRGEFAGGLKHGFGVGWPGDNARYFGRYDRDAMNGVGVYCHPTGSRVEGMFIGNRLDGPGSFYEVERTADGAETWTATHHVYQVGRKSQEMHVPFTPTAADLPDDSNQVRLSSIPLSPSYISLRSSRHVTRRVCSAR